MVAVSLLARCAGRMAIESLLSNLNEPRNNIVRGVSVSPASGASSWPSGHHGRDPSTMHLRLVIARAIRTVPAIFEASPALHDI